MSQSIKLFDMKIGLSKAETNDYWEIEGLASSEDADLQGEIIRQDGLDLTEFNRKRLVFNDNHSKDTKDILGIVEHAELRPTGLYVKGKLFKTNPASQVYYNLLKHKGYVGFSVEGMIRKRESFNDKIVKEAKLTAIALTRYPVNESTYARLIKSLSSPESDAVQKASAPIEPEGLASLPSGQVEPSPAEKLEVQAEVLNFLKKFPKPSDDQIHEVANKLRIDEHKFEELIYEMLGSIGKHKEAKDSEFDQEQLRMGIMVENEHTDNVLIAKEIAKDHLKEISDYYTRLAIMEDEAKSMEKGKIPLPEGTEKEWQGKHYEKRGGEWKEVAHSKPKDVPMLQPESAPKEAKESVPPDPALVEEIKNIQEQYPKIKELIDKIVSKYGASKTTYDRINTVLAPLKSKKESKEKVKKALSPGGPQYTGSPGDISGGSVFMSESNENSMRRKKLKNKIRQTMGAYKKLYRNASKEKIIKKTFDYFMSEPQLGYIAEEFAKGPKLSAKPPKGWWDRMTAKVRSSSPHYSEEQVKRTVGSMWYNKMSTKQRSGKRRAEGKTLKKSDELKELRKSILKEVIQRLKKAYPNMPYEKIVQLGLDIYNEKIRKIL